jgi:formylglycine-generating enzyme required for sulfatase activity
VASARFSPDGRRVVTAAYDHRARIFEARPESRPPEVVADLVRRRVPLVLAPGGNLLPRQAAAPKSPGAPRGKSQERLARQAAQEPAVRATFDLPTAHARPLLQPFAFEWSTVGPDGAARQQKGSGKLFREDLGGSVHLDMVAIPGGRFVMGSADALGQSEEQPRHEVTVAPFFMGRYEVTQAQWKAIMGDHRFTFHDRDDLPVESVTWYEAMEFCERLSRLTGRTYRLPTDAEWEYACRAGTETEFAHGDTVSLPLVNIDHHGNHGDAPGGYRRRTTPVGSLPNANAFGLYDMHGNVFEWCLDPFHEHYRGAPADGSSWEDGPPSAFRVLRGGSWRWVAYYARSAYRRRLSPDSWGNDLGFRVVVPATE